MRRPCCEKEGINKGAWSKQEDQQLIDYISSHGEGCWRSIPKAAGLRRCGKSCRLRWINYLRPDIKRGNFSHDEEDLIVKLHALLGNRWSLIAGRLPGRTDNEVKNYWNSHVRKKLIRMGIDPNNHKLHQHLPRRPLTSHTSQITESSGSMEDASKPSNCVNNSNNSNNNNNNNSNNNDSNNNDDDGANSLGEKLVVDSIGDHDNDEASRARLDLNLDLTIAVSRSPAMEKIKVEDSYEVITTAGFGSTEVEQAAPTLNLFR